MKLMYCLMGRSIGHDAYGVVQQLFDKKELLEKIYYVYDADREGLYDTLILKFLEKYKLKTYCEKSVNSVGIQRRGKSSTEYFEFKKVDKTFKEMASSDAKDLEILFYKPENTHWYSQGWAMGFFEESSNFNVRIYGFPVYGATDDETQWKEMFKDIANNTFRQHCKQAHFRIHNWGARPNENIISKEIRIYRDFESYKKHYGEEMKEF